MKGTATLDIFIQKWANDKGDGISIIETTTDKKITYQELFYAIASLQNFLGENPQTIILATAGNISSSIIWLAAMMYGHNLIPISPNTTEFEF